MLNADYDQYIYATGSGDRLHLPGTRVTLDIDEFTKGKFVGLPNHRVHSGAQVSRTIEINRGDCIKQIPLLTASVVSSLVDIDISEISSGGKFVSEKDRIAFRNSQTKRPAPIQKATPPPKKEGKTPKKEKNQDPNSSAKGSISQNNPPPPVPEFFSTNTSNEQGTTRPSPDEISQDVSFMTITHEEKAVTPWYEASNLPSAAFQRVKDLPSFIPFKKLKHIIAFAINDGIEQIPATLPPIENFSFEAENVQNLPSDKIMFVNIAFTSAFSIHNETFTGVIYRSTDASNFILGFSLL